LATGLIGQGITISSAAALTTESVWVFLVRDTFYEKLSSILVEELGALRIVESVRKMALDRWAWKSTYLDNYGIKCSYSAREEQS
jgi:hypothetical protein